MTRVAPEIREPSNRLPDARCVVGHVLGALRVPALHQDECLDLVLAEHSERGIVGAGGRSMLSRYVEQELRAYLKCGVFSEGFTRAQCETCGHDLLVAFSGHGRSICPSCCGRRMANVAAHLVDRVLPDVPVRQFVLTLPYELRKLAAFKADVLTALARFFVEAIFAVYCARAKSKGLTDAQCGSVTFVQRFGSLNLNVHFHVIVLDGVFTRDERGSVLFHAPPSPTIADLEAIVARTARRATRWLERPDHVEDRLLEERSNDAAAQAALDACATLAMGRGRVATLLRDGEHEEQQGDMEERPDRATRASRSLQRRARGTVQR